MTPFGGQRRLITSRRLIYTATLRLKSEQLQTRTRQPERVGGSEDGWRRRGVNCVLRMRTAGSVVACAQGRLSAHVPEAAP